MASSAEHNLIKRVQTTLAHDAPIDFATLQTLGVSAALASYYVKSGWLLRLGRGMYAFPGAKLSADESLKLLQELVPGLHVAGKSALAMQGVTHNLRASTPMVLWGSSRALLPKWFMQRFPARYAHGQLFDWKNAKLAASTLTTPPGVTEGLLVSVPERAALEMLYDVGIHESLEEARNLFDGLRNFRAGVVGALLARCRNVKTVRLFLAWARETKLVDVDLLLEKNDIPVGSDKRWMSRLQDGTLLTLKPHG